MGRLWKSLFHAMSCSRPTTPSYIQKNSKDYCHIYTSLLYKMLVAVHSDNTGSREYADALTESRVSAIADYLIQASGGNDDILLVPYAQGMDEPLTSNDRRENRRKNRRVEIYLIPDKPLFKRLK